MTSGPGYHEEFIRVTGNGGQTATPSDEVESRLSTVETDMATNTSGLTTLETLTASGVGIDQSARDHVHDVENVTNQTASRHTALSTNHQQTRDTLLQLLEAVHGSTVAWPEGASLYTTNGSLLTSFRSTLDFQLNEWPNMQSSISDVNTLLQALTVRVEALEADHAGPDLYDFDNPPVSDNPLRLHIDASHPHSLYTDTTWTTKATSGSIGSIRDLTGSGHHMTMHSQFNSQTSFTVGMVYVPGTTTRKTIHNSVNSNYYEYIGTHMFSDTATTGGCVFMVLKTSTGSGSPLRLGGTISPHTTHPTSIYYESMWMASDSNQLSWPNGGSHHLYIVRGDPTLSTTRVYAMNATTYKNDDVPTPVHQTAYSTNMLAQGVMCGEFVGDLCEIKRYTGTMSDEDFDMQAKHLIYKWVE